MTAAKTPAKKRGLGRGLEALLGPKAAAEALNVSQPAVSAMLRLSSCERRFLIDILVNYTIFRNMQPAAPMPLVAPRDAGKHGGKQSITVRDLRFLRDGAPRRWWRRRR